MKFNRRETFSKLFSKQRAKNIQHFIKLYNVPDVERPNIIQKRRKVASSSA